MDKKANEIKTFFSRCRCCLEYGYLKNMWKEYTHNGEPEVYGDMLTKCFALIWDETENSKEQDQICEPCVQRLRDASDFKSTVLNSQAKLSITGEGVVKEEYLAETLESDDDTSFIIYPTGEDDSEDSSDDPDDESDTSRDRSEMEFKDDVKSEMNDFEVEYLEDDEDSKALFSNTSTTGVNETSNTSRRKRQRRTKEEIEKEGGGGRKWPKKLPKHERRKTYKQYTEEDMRKSLEAVRSQKLTPTEAGKKYGVPKKTIRAKLRSDSQDVQSESEEIEKKNSIKVPIRGKFNENVRTILRHSNATPIKGPLGVGFACCYCSYRDPKPEKIKKHTLNEHSSETKVPVIAKCAAELIIKLDVTDLTCKLCDQGLGTLEKLMEHLNEDHSKLLHFDIPNLIIPFKFDSDCFECVNCGNQYDNFKSIAEHMNEHYSNYVCSRCDRGFINKRSLQMHLKRHETGVHPCLYCSKVFDTRIKMKEHARVVHVMNYMIRKCAYCDERFMDSAKKEEHLIKVHGAPVTQYECGACNKKLSARSLADHIRRVHLRVKKIVCSECGKGFYNKTGLKQHLKVHMRRELFQ